MENCGDIRDVISIGKLVRKSDGPQVIELIMETMIKYGAARTLLYFEKAILDSDSPNRYLPR
jgi:hypothetical protein